MDVNELKNILSKDYLYSDIELKLNGNQAVLTVDKNNVVRVLFALRDNHKLMCKQLIDLCAVDYPEREERFEVIYNLLSLKYNFRLVVKVNIGEGEELDSVCSVFSNANWFEREVFDMYGVQFKEHPDLRRILTDYGFNGHPQRKDFPLTGYKEVKYDDNKKKVVYEDVELQQEFRNFDFLSPWEGTEYAPLPGDEKAK